MKKQSIFIATSLDGYIARSDGNIDWLTEGEESGEDFIASVDAVVVGRHTFEKVLSFGKWPYDLHVVVLSSQTLEIPDKLQQKVSHLSGAPEEIVNQLAGDGTRICISTAAIRFSNFYARA